MKDFPAICIIEVASIATGYRCTDAMLKKAPVTVLKAGTVHPGKFLIFIGGSVAAVEEAWQTGIYLADKDLIDQVFLPDIHEAVLKSMTGQKLVFSDEAVGVFETKTVCATIRAADKSVKGTDIEISVLRIADDLGGNAFVIYSGKIEEVQAALDLAGTSFENDDFLIRSVLIPRPDAGFLEQLGQQSEFRQNEMKILDDGEI